MSQLLVLALIGVLLGACGPSDDTIKDIVDERIETTLAAIPEPSSVPTATPQPVLEMISVFLTAVPTFTPTPAPTFTPTPIATATPTPTSSTSAWQGIDFSEVYQRINRSVFYLELPSGHGSGWLVDQGLILTNAHVVSGLSTVVVRQSLNSPFSASVVAVDVLRDIALLQFDKAIQLDPKAKPLPIGEIPEESIAQSLLSLGYSDSAVKEDGTVGSAAANVGVLSQIIDFGPSSFGLNLMMDAPIDPGDSGGPVVNADGLVIGMARAVRVQTTGGQRVVGTFYAIHVDEIKIVLPLLKEHVRGNNDWTHRR